MPKTNPVNVSARGMRVEPTAQTIVRVIVCIAPVCLKASAMIDPSTITTPMDPSVEPKPNSNAAMKLFCCTPGITPKKRSGTSRARKTCQRHLAMRNNRSIMTPKKATSANNGLLTTAVEGSMLLPYSPCTR